MYVEYTLVITQSRQKHAWRVFRWHDLAAETLLKFNEDWDFELRCCGEINGLPEKRLVKLYIEQLRPRQLSYNVKLTDPQKLTDAQKVAYEAAKMLRIVKQQAKYFQQSNDKPKHQTTFSKTTFKFKFSTPSTTGNN